MNKQLHDLAANVEDEESFIRFVKELIADRKNAVKMESISPAPGSGPDAGGWENRTIEDFLDGAVAWAESSEFGSVIKVTLGTEQTPTNPQNNAVSPVQYDDLLRRQIDSFDVKRLANLVQGLINAQADIPHQMGTCIQ